MPLIVYKTMDLNVQYTQAMRIECEHCGKIFSYALGESENFQTTGIPLVSGDEGMREAVKKQAMKKMAKIAHKPRRGQALCPHCKKYQQWMVNKDTLGTMGCWFGIGLLALPALLLLASWIAGWNTSSEYLWAAIGGCVLGLVIGKKLSITVGPHSEQEDGRAMTDEDLAQYLNKCKDEDVNAVMAWYCVSHNKMPDEKDKTAWITLGILDLTREPIDFQELSTDAVLAELK